jgi:signal transduction histidine kinase
MATIEKQLLSQLTHHLRSPFNGIIGFSDLLANHFDKLSDNDKRSYIQIVNQLSKKALLRSENLAWWLKGYFEKITLVKQNLDLADLIKDELIYFNNEIEHQQLELQLELNDNIIINADKVMIESVIKNLLLNIIEYTPVGEIVMISLSKFDEQLIQLTMLNVCSEIPSEETINLVNSTRVPDVNTMPNQPGLWTVRTLCAHMEIPIAMSLKSNQLEVKLSISY